MATNLLKILPDLSLVVEVGSGEDAAVVNETMSAFAEPTETTSETTSTSCHYRVTAASVWQARRQGISLAAMLDSLKTYGQTDIPAKLRADMVLWSTQIDRLQLQVEQGRLILRSHNQAAISAVLRHPSLQTFIAQQIDASSLELKIDTYPEVVATFDTAQQPVLDQVQREMLTPPAPPKTPRRRQPRVKKTAPRRATKKRRPSSSDVADVAPSTPNPTGQAESKERFIEEFDWFGQPLPRQCQALTKAGRQCRNRARLPSTFCQVHTDWVPPPDQDLFQDPFDAFPLPAYLASTVLNQLIEDGVLSVPQLALIRMFLVGMSGLTWWLFYTTLTALNSSWLQLPLATWGIAGLSFGLMCVLLGRVLAGGGLFVGLRVIYFLLRSVLFDYFDREGILLNLCFFIMPIVIPVSVIYYYALSGWWSVVFFPLGLLFGRLCYGLLAEIAE